MVSLGLRMFSRNALTTRPSAPPWPCTGWTANAERSRQVFEQHLAQVRRFMAGRGCFRVLPLQYHEVVAAPEAAAARVAQFLGRRLDTAAMARSVERQLYRNRVAPASK